MRWAATCKTSELDGAVERVRIQLGLPDEVLGAGLDALDSADLVDGHRDDGLAREYRCEAMDRVGSGGVRQVEVGEDAVEVVAGVASRIGQGRPWVIATEAVAAVLRYAVIKRASDLSSSTSRTRVGAVPAAGSFTGSG